MKGTAGTNSQHTINEDERRSFTDHINAVLAGDPDVGHLLPIPTDTMQLFDEVKGGYYQNVFVTDFQTASFSASSSTTRCPTRLTSVC